MSSEKRAPKALARGLLRPLTSYIDEKFESLRGQHDQQFTWIHEKEDDIRSSLAEQRTLLDHIYEAVGEARRDSKIAVQTVAEFARASEPLAPSPRPTGSPPSPGTDQRSSLHDALMYRLIADVPAGGGVVLGTSDLGDLAPGLTAIGYAVTLGWSDPAQSFSATLDQLTRLSAARVDALLIRTAACGMADAGHLGAILAGYRSRSRLLWTTRIGDESGDGSGDIAAAVERAIGDWDVASVYTLADGDLSWVAHAGVIGVSEKTPASMVINAVKP